jgi:hypothetical protein
LNQWIAVWSREHPRQVLEEFRIVGQDRRHRRRHRLLGVARAQRRLELLLALLGAHEDDARGLAVGRSRTPLHEIVDFVQLLVGHRLVEPAVVRAGFAEDGGKRLVVEHGNPLVLIDRSEAWPHGRDAHM